jgi:hypothetical protein
MVHTKATKHFESSSYELSLLSAVKSSSTLKDTVCEVTAKRCAEEFGARLCSVVLTGSLARDEATFVHEGERWKLMGDAEFFLVFMERGALPPPATVDQLQREIEGHLLKGGLSGHIELSPVHTRYLRTMPPEIFAYELRTRGQVVWGDRGILALVPRFGAEDIPLEDAWRLLSNRMIELLEVVPSLPCSLSSVPYSAVKLYLDMTTSYLVFRGLYASTYLERAERLRELAESGDAKCSCPFSLRGFAAQVFYCTRFKLQGPEGVTGRGAEAGLEVMFSWKELVSYSSKLWRWELEQLTRSGRTARRTVATDNSAETGAPTCTLSDRELMRKWMQSQPLRKKLQGWASALRRSGWQPSWRQLSHWIRFGRRASPRYWVYAAASELFFRLPDLLCGKEQSADAGAELRKLRSWLPAVRDVPEAHGSLSWRDVAADIILNYHKFLKGTRA